MNGDDQRPVPVATPGNTTARTSSRAQTLLGAYALTCVTLCVVGGIRAYSPVPYWDSWDGIVRFWLLLREGEQGLWFAGHNEHRIVLSRLLFWIDQSAFGGAGSFLVVCNYLLLAALAASFVAILLSTTGEGRRWRRHASIAALLVAWLFSWAQNENLTWAFQSQVFLALLLPLWAFHFLGTAFDVDTRRPRGRFALACGLGVLSAGTMAGALLVLPLMVAAALASRQSTMRIAALVTLTVLVITGYLLPDRTATSQVLMAHGLPDVNGITAFVLIYLGNPFHAFFPSGLGISMPFVAGVAFVVLTVIGTIRHLRPGRIDPATRTCALFIAYGIGTGLATALGRSEYGLDTATSGRYVTFALATWAALAIVHADGIDALLARRHVLFVVCLGLGMALFLRYQFTGIRSHQTDKFERSLAMLAVVLQIDDAERIGVIYPAAATAFAIARDAAKADLAPFSAPPFGPMRAGIGNELDGPAGARCEVVVDQRTAVKGDPLHVRIRGRVTGSPAAIALVGPDHRTVGFALAAPGDVPVDGTRLAVGTFVGYATSSWTDPTTTRCEAL